MDFFPVGENIDEVYVDAMKLPDKALRDRDRLDESTYHFEICTLSLEVDGSKFSISSETPSKFTLKCLDVKNQDVLVEVHSAIFKIVDARRSKGITSQAFRVLKRNESMSFEIAFKDLNNISLENFNNINLTSAAGYMTITQMDSYKKDDSDAEWGVADGKKQLVRMVRSRHLYEFIEWEDIAHYKHWREKLFVETETDEVKRAKRFFAEALMKKLQMLQVKTDEENKKGQKMYISPEEIQKEEDEKKKIKEAEEKEKKDREDQKIKDKNMDQWVKEKKKKEKKKCVIL